jgi:hypothetical protein
LKTPPKRTRLEGEYSPLTRISKRGSEEAALSSVAAGKRPRVGDGEAEDDDKSTSTTTRSGGGNAPVSSTTSSEPSACLEAGGREGLGGEA